MMGMLDRAMVGRIFHTPEIEDGDFRFLGFEADGETGKSYGIFTTGSGCEGMRLARELWPKAASGEIIGKVSPEVREVAQRFARQVCDKYGLK
jgi:hypothetical protein